MAAGDDDPTLRPEGVVGPFLPVTELDIATFADILSDEIDSVYASSICCCDNCYQVFRQYWPGVAFRDMEFQTQSIELSLFIEQSRLIDLYSPAEISTLKRLVCCPRCSSLIAHNIWIYEHRFSDSSALEHTIDELATLGGETPFLILENDFARAVLSQIRKHHIEPTCLPFSLFRARPVQGILESNQALDDIQTFGPAPAELTREGRFNHAGSSMLYLGSTAETALKEIGRPGIQVQVAELAFSLKPLLILDLVDLDENSPSYEIFASIANSALLAAPQSGTGWIAKQYVFSRFVADCAKSAGFNAIRYGSTKYVDGSNYVLLRPPADIADVARLISSRSISL